MRKLPQAEAGYWLDSFPIDLAVGLAYGVPTGLLCGAACYFLSIRYLAQHHTLDPAQHGIASSSSPAFSPSPEPSSPLCWSSSSASFGTSTATRCKADRVLQKSRHLDRSDRMQARSSNTSESQCRNPLCSTSPQTWVPHLHDSSIVLKVGEAPSPYRVKRQSLNQPSPASVVLNSRAPKIPVPIRTHVEPSSIATAKSCVIPIDNSGNATPVSSCTRSRSSRSCRK